MDEGQSQKSSHPRRPPAHKSVSLLHSPRTSPQPDPAKKHKHRIPTSNRVDPGPTLSSIPANPDKTGSSGESSNAEKWFEKSNQNVRTGSISLLDNDPPFFLRNSSSSETSPDMAGRGRVQLETPPDIPPQHSGLMLLDHAGSGSEDFRSVIDDLTIQNKKLKRRLKKYERLHDGHLQGDKLFEIRVHALPPDKKRELENTLRKFASTLSEAPQDGTSGNASERLSAAPNMDTLVTTSSLGNVDSAYASLSGLNSSTQSGRGSNKVFRKGVTPGMSHAQQQNIHTYLSDIPVGLLPRQPVPMTEKAKRKLVVRRLEQLFAGKGASMGGHQQPIQQEEISRSAAHDERTAREASGRLNSREGAREARIMPSSKQQNARELAAGPDVDQDMGPTNAPAFPNVSSKEFADLNREATPEQRPTRPLDLDPNRAQIPAENIKYLRHLGFSPIEADSNEDLMDGHGYMYLNVLINMAQLHTINVTPEFVKKSVEQYSNKLELSPDGRKVRWKGGSDLTRTSSSGSPDDESSSGQPVRLDGRKTGLTSNMSGDSTELNSKSGAMPKEPGNKMAYVPLFFHREENVNDDSDEDMSGWSSPAAADSSNFMSSGKHTTSSKKRHGNDGPIIFYNQAPFVTDLSGDWRGANVKSVNLQNYVTLPMRAVGIPRTPAGEQALLDLDRKGSLFQVPATADSMDIDSTSASSNDPIHGLSKPPSIGTGASSSGDSPDPVEFEASGLGGVQPSDNFAINIKSRHKLTREHSTYAGPNSRSQTYPPQIRAILEKSREHKPSSKAAQNRAVEAEIISSSHKDLPASQLPPPSFYPISGQDDEDDEDDYTDSDGECTDSDDEELFTNQRPLPSARPQLIHWPSDETPRSVREMKKEDEEENDSDDSSIDMLAHARDIKLGLIRSAEREYDGAIADRLAEEMPVGSSAATAGGGSGFNSPEKPDVGSSPGKGPVPTPAQRGTLKRARTSDERLPRTSKSPKLEG